MAVKLSGSNPKIYDAGYPNNVSCRCQMLLLIILNSTMNLFEVRKYFRFSYPALLVQTQVSIAKRKSVWVSGYEHADISSLLWEFELIPLREMSFEYPIFCNHVVLVIQLWKTSRGAVKRKQSFWKKPKYLMNTLPLKSSDSTVCSLPFPS
jgi:hypothetical protein